MTRTARAEAKLLKAIRLARLAIVQFVVLCLLAIAVFPGKFHLLENNLSDLGVFHTFFSLHAWLFNGSLIALGCGLFALFRALVRVRADHFDDLRACGVTGMAAGIAIIFVGLIPWTVSYYLHTFAMALWLLFTVLVLVFWADWRRLKRRGRPRSVGKLSVAAIVVYPVAAAFGSGPAMQKVIVVLSLICLLWFSVELEQTVRSGAARRRLLTGKRQRLTGWSDLARGGGTPEGST